MQHYQPWPIEFDQYGENICIEGWAITVCSLYEWLTMIKRATNLSSENRCWSFRTRFYHAQRQGKRRRSILIFFSWLEVAWKVGRGSAAGQLIQGKRAAQMCADATVQVCNLPTHTQEHRCTLTVDVDVEYRLVLAVRVGQHVDCEGFRLNIGRSSGHTACITGCECQWNMFHGIWVTPPTDRWGQNIRCGKNVSSDYQCPDSMARDAISSQCNKTLICFSSLFVDSDGGWIC